MVAAWILYKIEKRLAPRRINDIFDMIVGTSTGGILALGLSKGMTAKELVELYGTKGGEIFQDRIGVGYSSKGVRLLLEHHLGTLTFNNITKVQVGVQTCMLLETKGDAVGVMLSNFDSDMKDPDYVEITLVDAALATSAAPTYFDPHKIKRVNPKTGVESKFICVDGGVTQNNPAMLAHVQAA